MLGTKFPVSEYYRDKIMDAVTVSRGGNWWTAILLISDPRSGDPFIGLYKWQNSEGEWKTRNRFLFKKKADLQATLECLQNFSKHLK